MGMQVHWDIKDVPDYAVVTKCGIESNEWVITMPNEHPVYVNNPEGGCWFDCGSCSDWSMDMIQWLIKNRIPFHAS